MKLNRSLRHAAQVVMVAIVPALSACKAHKSKTEPAKPAASAAATAGVQLAFKPTAAQKEAAQALAENAGKRGYFPRADKKKENGPLFLWLAATSKDPNVIAAALDGMQRTYANRPNKRYLPVDNDYVKVISYRFGTDNDLVLKRCFDASSKVLSGRYARPELVKRVLEITNKQNRPAVEFAALDALYNIPDRLQTDAVKKLYVGALDSGKPFLISNALWRLSLMHPKFSEDLRARAEKLANNADPGVRGRALDLMSSLWTRDKKTIEVALQKLTDKNAFVRSEACDTLASAGYKPAIHKIAPLLSDKAPNTYDIRGFPTLDGSHGWLHHDGSAWSRVYDAAMRAIERLSQRKWTMPPIRARHAQADLDKAAQSAKAWYAKNKASIPKS